MALRLAIAIGLAVEKLSGLEIESYDKSNHKITSRVIILLTDGENTAGNLQPLPAAELAKSMGIKIYTIGVGDQRDARRFRFAIRFPEHCVFK